MFPVSSLLLQRSELVHLKFNHQTIYDFLIKSSANCFISHDIKNIYILFGCNSGLNCRIFCLHYNMWDLDLHHANLVVACGIYCPDQGSGQAFGIGSTDQQGSPTSEIFLLAKWTMCSLWSIESVPEEESFRDEKNFKTVNSDRI